MLGEKKMWTKALLKNILWVFAISFVLNLLLIRDLSTIQLQGVVRLVIICVVIGGVVTYLQKRRRF